VQTLKTSPYFKVLHANLITRNLNEAIAVPPMKDKKNITQQVAWSRVNKQPSNNVDISPVMSDKEVGIKRVRK